jgi:hypothetical protein
VGASGSAQTIQSRNTMAKGTSQLTSVQIRVKRPEDMQKVVDQIHTLTKRLSAGSGVRIEIVSDVTPTSKDTEADEAALL